MADRTDLCRKICLRAFSLSLSLQSGYYNYFLLKVKRYWNGYFYVEGSELTIDFESVGERETERDRERREREG